MAAATDQWQDLSLPEHPSKPAVSKQIAMALRPLRPSPPASAADELLHDFATPVHPEQHADLLARTLAAAGKLRPPEKPPEAPPVVPTVTVAAAAPELEPWEALGFQSGAIHTDFRGGGLLSLRTLLHHLENHTADAEQMLTCGENSTSGSRLPLATTSINISSMLAALLRLPPRPVDSHIGNADGGLQATATAEVVPPALVTLTRENGGSAVAAFGQLHAYAMQAFLALWQSSGASLLEGDFEKVLEMLRTSIGAALFGAAGGGGGGGGTGGPSGAELADWVADWVADHGRSPSGKSATSTERVQKNRLGRLGAGRARNAKAELGGRFSRLTPVFAIVHDTGAATPSQQQSQQ
eukprot:SAG22_NODE_3952_length_1452_cov_2.889135_1_plen_353_part_10